MGKHNGKARKSSGQQKVGSALLSRQTQQTRRGGGETAFRHTTDVADGTNMQSVVMENDLSELLRMADLSGRDFAGEKANAVIVSTTNAQVAHLSDEERQALLARHPEAMNIPRRPNWNRSMKASQVQEQERSAFLEWRRRLARLESEEGLIITPFEKNLEVWRQLWRVLERSDVIVQVVDARDPLFYRSEDLEKYARSVQPHAHCLLLLNKADLLPNEVRTMWADYLDVRGVRYAFWSAFSSSERQKREGTAAAQLLASEAAAMAPAADRMGGEAAEPADARIHVLDETELIELLSSEAAAAVPARPSPAGVDRAGDDGSEGAVEEAPGEGDDVDGRSGASAPHAPPTVGLIGFPNVGKSSTINALFGSKKTAVAATPGKTKHFQTLYVTPELRLCDCPGLVMPRLATSAADMVAAGVVPIDRLTDVLSSVSAIAARVSRQQMFAKLKITLPQPKCHEEPDRAPTAHEILSAYATNRGWLNGSGLPDQTRSARALLKDYTTGRLVFCEWPPGKQRRCYHDDGLGTFTSESSLLQYSAGRVYGKSVKTALQPRLARGAKPAGRPGVDDISIMDGNIGVINASKMQRSDHKFQKKPQKHAGVNARVLAKAGVSPYGTFESADAQDLMQTGKRGGIVRL
eukprot:jgi/Ulvmu1/4786/UM020_0071.1